jgi:molybdenum cofactor cytidylyltransferase
MSSSVAVGFACAIDRFSSHRYALLWPVDIPLVQPATVQALLAAEPDARVVIPTFEGRGGHPPRIERSLWPALSQCENQPMGAKSIFLGLKPPPLRAPVADRGVVTDFDTVTDLK